MKDYIKWASCGLVILVAGCTHQGMYPSAQNGREMNCSAITDSDDRARCYEDARMSHRPARTEPMDSNGGGY
ncbi:hypothetical protein [Marinobacter caseinilyticus]|uniref:hypothetical protein n=1 Tax=Marinobacter caseinilyticus TaxID=2692195 RepID=UPI00140CAA1B|nr:hypothetical protein [Marinobacter caseinilyticus]